MPQYSPANNKFQYCTDKEICTIEKKAVELRESVVEMLVEAGSGHIAGALGTADIFAVLYHKILNIDPKDPHHENRDRFILSNGHICPVWYAVLAQVGFFHKNKLKTLRKLDSGLQGHPRKNSVPGIENSSGSLGQGLSQAIGLALGAKLSELSYRVYCMLGDGEMQEGQVWEALMYAGNKRLNNLTCIIDRNNIQISGYTENVMPLESLREKLEAFNWHVLEVDGHNVEELVNSFNMAKAVFERPTAIVAHTIPGKGADFMEYKFEWHGKVPSAKEAKKALNALRSLEGRIKCYDDE